MRQAVVLREVTAHCFTNSSRLRCCTVRGFKHTPEPSKHPALCLIVLLPPLVPTTQGCRGALAQGSHAKGWWCGAGSTTSEPEGHGLLVLRWHSQRVAAESTASGNNRWSAFKWERIEYFNTHTSLIQFYEFDFCLFSDY